MTVVFCACAFISIMLSWRVDTLETKLRQQQIDIDRLQNRVDTLVDEYIIGIKPRG